MLHLRPAPLYHMFKLLCEDLTALPEGKKKGCLFEIVFYFISHGVSVQTQEGMTRRGGCGEHIPGGGSVPF